jgi:alpha-acetolactate decarboxylase
MAITVGELISNLKQYDPELEIKFDNGQVFYRTKDHGNFVSIQIGEDDKTPQEASNIFHSIMKASVSKPATEKKEKKEVKPKGKPKK